MPFLSPNASIRTYVSLWPAAKLRYCWTYSRNVLHENKSVNKKCPETSVSFEGQGEGEGRGEDNTLRTPKACWKRTTCRDCRSYVDGSRGKIKCGCRGGFRRSKLTASSVLRRSLCTITGWTWPLITMWTARGERAQQDLVPGAPRTSWLKDYRGERENAKAPLSVRFLKTLRNSMLFAFWLLPALSSSFLPKRRI